MMTLKLVKVPRWIHEGIDLKPKLDDALETVGERMERQGRGLGAQRNVLRRERAFLEQRVFTSLHHPRRTGSALKSKDTSIFKGMSGRVVGKIVKDVEAEWAR